MQEFIKAEGIREHRYRLRGNKETAEDMDRGTVADILVLLSGDAPLSLVSLSATCRHVPSAVVACRRW